MTYALDLSTLTVSLTTVNTTSVVFTVEQVPVDVNFAAIVVKYRAVGSASWLTSVLPLPISVGALITIAGLLEETAYEFYVVAQDLTSDLSDIDAYFLATTLSSSQPAFAPVSDRILDNIVSSLQAIAPGSEYFNSFAIVTRKQIAEFEQVNLPACIVYEQESEEEEAAYNQIQRVQMNVAIEAHYRAHGEIDREADQFRSDIKKALMVDDTRGGLAINTTVIHSAKFHATTSNERGLLIVFVTINFRHRRTDPTIVCG